MDIREKLKEHLNNKGLRQSEVSKALDISTTTLSLYLNNSYDGNLEKLETSIIKYLNRQNDKDQEISLKATFYNISTSNNVFEIAKNCHILNTMGVLMGQAGSGKTTAIKEYAKNNQGVIIVKANKTISSKRPFFQAIHRNIGMSGKGGTDRVFNDIVRALKDSDRLLIVDEAENLNYDSLDTLHNLYDECNIGILLVGTERLLNNITGNLTNYSHICSRITENLILNSLLKKDVELIINDIFPNQNGLWKSFYEHSRGNARYLFQIIKKVKKRTTELSSEPNEKIVNVVAKSTLRADLSN